MLINPNDLKSDLKNGIVEIKFTKKDGSERTMKATLNSDLIPKESFSEEKNLLQEQKFAADPLFKVWDTEALGWRSMHQSQINKIVV